MAYKVEFLPEAAEEFEALDGSLKKIAAKQIDKVAERPELGAPLGKRMGIDLTGYRKLYFGRKAYRIVYELRRERLVNSGCRDWKTRKGRSLQANRRAAQESIGE